MPLLPTALQLDLVCAALRRAGRGPAGVALRDVTVRAPVRCAAPRTLIVQTRPVPGHTDDRIALVDAGQGEVHLTVASARTGSAALEAPAADPSTTPPGRLSGAPGLVYPPLFHGRAFQVLGRFGRHGDTFVATPAHVLSGWDLAGQGGGLPAHLLELLLQACGVCELAATGRMMRPQSVARVEVSPSPADHFGDLGAQAQAHVSVRAYGGPQDRSFDGVAVDAERRVLLRITGNRPVELDLAVDPAAVLRIRQALARDAVPEPRSTRGVTR